MTDQLQGVAPPPPGVTPDFKHPQDILATINLVSGILGIALMAPFVIGRIFIKVHFMKNMVLEDFICDGILPDRTIQHGGGNHEYEVTKKNMVGFQQALYADTIVYGPAAWTTKTTLLLIFARVFSPFRKSVIFIYVFIGLMFCYYFPVMIIKIRACTPIEALWNPNIHAECVDQTRLFWTDTIMSALTDFVILVLPIPLVWSLQVTFKKKVRIAILLGAGGIATAASIIRLILVFQPNSFADETVSFVRFNLLGVAEIGIGIICACMPAFNVLLTRWTTENASRNSRKTNASAEIKLSNVKISSRGTKVTPNPGSTSLSSYIEVGSPRDTMFSHTSQKRQLSVDAMSRHTRSALGGAYDDNGTRDTRRVHKWIPAPYFPDDGIGRAV